MIEAIGSDCNTDWLEGNDLDASVGAGVRTDRGLRALRADGTPWDDAYVVGDMARFPNDRYPGSEQTVPHWNTATDTGRRAGQVISAHLAGDEADLRRVVSEPFSPIPSFWSDQYDLHMLGFGLLDLADDIRLVEGRPDGDCVYRYYRQGATVGVCAIGCRATVQSLRSAVGTAPHLAADTSL